MARNSKSRKLNKKRIQRGGRVSMPLEYFTGKTSPRFSDHSAGSGGSLTKGFEPYSPDVARTNYQTGGRSSRKSKSSKSKGRKLIKSKSRSKSKGKSKRHSH